MHDAVSVESQTLKGNTIKIMTLQTQEEVHPTSRIHTWKSGRFQKAVTNYNLLKLTVNVK